MGIKFFGCEVLNFVNVLGQMFFMDLFLGGEFTTYGSDVIAMTDLEQEQRTDPLSRVFPKVTKCTFHKFGPSGTVQKFDGLCVLPLNIINEKIYVFLWFWFVILAIITAIQVFHSLYDCLNFISISETQVMYRLATCFVPSMREMLLKARSRLTKKPGQVEGICRKFGLGDWFLLYQLGKNIDPLIFREFIADLHNKLLRLDAERNDIKLM